MSVFEVLAEPHRRLILDLVREQERPVGELVDALGLSQPAVSKHLRVLRDSGLVGSRVDAQRRLYRARTAALREIDDWLAPYRRMWDASLDDLSRHLEEMAMSTEDRDYGTTEQRGDGKWQLRFQRSFPHAVEKLWRAVTEPEHLAAWFPTTIDGDRRAGAHLQFVFPNGEAPPFDGEVVAYEPPSLFEFRWGPDSIRMEITGSGTSSTITLLHAFDERGKAARDAAGWHVCLDALAAALNGSDKARDQMSRWSQVHPHYVERFGPEAATIGPPQQA